MRDLSVIIISIVMVIISVWILLIPQFRLCLNLIVPRKTARLRDRLPSFSAQKRWMCGNCENDVYLDAV